MFESYDREKKLLAALKELWSASFEHGARLQNAQMQASDLIGEIEDYFNEKDKTQ